MSLTPEMRELVGWLGRFPRHPRQTHGLNESDAEILRLGRSSYLAATVDSVSEEIAYGLYKDPFTMGWVAAMASLSDLAAVGARPTGILFSAHWGPELPFGARAEVARGLRQALKLARAHLLGGDSGLGASTQLTVTSLGLCNSRPLGRIGIRPGDWIGITGQSGIGPALGFRHLLGDEPRALPESAFRPRARLTEGLRLRKIASAAIDTSDGIASALLTLSRLNGCSFELEWNPRAISPIARRYCRARGFPESSLWFGEHGDFQLLCAVPPARLAAARRAGLQILGRATRARSSTLDGKPIRLELVAEAPKRSLREFRAAFDEMICHVGVAGLP
jgi:thiamine-monophosphate kinase